MDVCTNPDLLRVVYFFNIIIDIVKIIVPIGLIIFGLIDFSKAMMSNEEKDQKKAVSLFMKRILYGVLIFAVPWIIEVLMITLGNLLEKNNMTNFTDCLENANSECIEALDSKNIETIKKVCDVPNGFTLEEDINDSSYEKCYYCTGVPNYEWSTGTPSTTCTGGAWTIVSKQKNECKNSGSSAAGSSTPGLNNGNMNNNIEQTLK